MSRKFPGKGPPLRDTERETTVLLAAHSTIVEGLAATLRRDVERVLAVSSLDDALSRLETSDIDCLVSDLELDDGTGVELLDAVRARSESPPFVVWTADGSEAIAGELIAAGVADYIPRNTADSGTDEAVAERIRRVVRRNRQLRTQPETDFAVLCDLIQRLSRADTVDDGLHTVMTEVCEMTEWAYGELWVPDANRERLTHATSYTLDDEFREFTTIARTTTFQKGEGLPGRVWATEDTEWVHDVSTLSPERYIRTDVAGRSDFGAACGVPVSAHGHIEAVLVYYLTEPRLPDTRLSRLVETVAAGFGGLVAGKQTEHTPREQQNQGCRETRRTGLQDESVLETLTEYIDVTLWMATPGFDDIVYTSPNFERISGYSRQEFHDEPGLLLDIIHPDDHERVRQAWENREDGYTLDYRIRTADGETRWIRERGCPVEQNGEIQAFVGKAEDVTEQKEREREFELFRTLVDHASDGFFVVDPDTSELLDVNQTACEHLGYERADLLSMSVTDINPEFTPDVWDDFVETVHQRGTRIIESTHRRKDESTFPVEVQVTCVSLDRDYHVATVRDITDRKERERELERQRELLRHTEEIARTGGWEANLETGEQRWTRGTRAIHEVSEDFEPTVEAGFDFFHPDDRDTIEDVFTRCTEAGEPYDVELRLVTAEDRIRWVRARGEPIREGGDVIGGRGAIQDVTERKEHEQELEAARRRYQTLVEAAPDPIFVADAETGEIVEANSVAAALRKQPREEIIGLHQTDLHPDDDADRYREMFQDSVGKQTTVRTFADGSQVYLVTADGDRIPVSISAGTVSLGDRTLIHGIFRDISEQKRYEDALKRVNTAAQELLNTETDTEIAHAVVDVATETLDPSAAVVYLYDEYAGELVPVASSDELEALVRDAPPISPGDGTVWSVFTEQELAKFDDARTADSAFGVGTPLRSQLLVPLGEYGVLVVGDTEVGACDEFCAEIAELLCATAEYALARAEQTQELHERERNSQMQARRLERAQQLNDEIRAIMNAVVEPHSHAAITQAVCDSLVTLDQFDSVWIGELDSGANELRLTSTAGTSEPYADALSKTLEADSTHPAVRATRNREPVVDSTIAENPQSDQWRQLALLYDLRSVSSVPLIHDDILYGVLTIASSEPGRFDELTQVVLAELGSLIGYALNTLDQRNALLEDETVTLTFDITGAEDVFVQLASRLETEIRFKSISTRSVGGYLVHFVVEKHDPDTVTALLEDVPGIQDSRLVSDSGQPLFEVTTIGECVATTIANMGANIHRVTVSETNCQINLSIPRDRNKQRFVAHLEEHYPDVELKAHRTSSVPTPSLDQQLEQQLTDRQQEILNTAYYSGFFDQPRKRTGKEIAASLGISQPAFSKQLRTAQKRLLESIYE